MNLALLSQVCERGVSILEITPDFRKLGVEDSIVINDAFNDFLTFQLSKLDIFSKEIDDTLAAEYKKQGIEVNTGIISVDDTVKELIKNLN